MKKKVIRPRITLNDEIFSHRKIMSFLIGKRDFAPIIIDALSVYIDLVNGMTMEEARSRLSAEQAAREGVTGSSAESGQEEMKSVPSADIAPEQGKSEVIEAAEETVSEVTGPDEDDTDPELAAIMNGSSGGFYDED